MQFPVVFRGHTKLTGELFIKIRTTGNPYIRNDILNRQLLIGKRAAFSIR